MGGLGPGVGGFEILVIGLVALLVVGPKDLPMLMRKVGQFVGKARGMANEFRASFDEMARQSELDDLRKEVEALRTGQGAYALGAEAEEAFKDIRKDLEAPLDAPAMAASAPALAEPEPGPEPEPVATGVDEWPDAVAAPVEAKPSAAKPRARKATPQSAATKAGTTKAGTTEAGTTKPAAVQSGGKAAPAKASPAKAKAKASSAKTPATKAKAPRARKIEP